VVIFTNIPVNRIFGFREGSTGNYNGGGAQQFEGDIEGIIPGATRFFEK
jgi:hypothetical protein